MMADYEWRVIQRDVRTGEELAIGGLDERQARGRQAVLDTNTSHPSGFQRRIDVVRIERREIGPWKAVE